MITDTHTHLYLPEFGDESDRAVKRALDAGVGMMIFPNVDLTTIRPMKELHSRFPESTRMAMGLHPTEVDDSMDDALSQITDELDRDRYVAVGEIGMDLYWDKTYREKQMEAFERQCRIAVGRGLPVIIHCREALDETLEVIEGVRGLTGVMHSFGGKPEDVDRVRSRADLYFGINGIATFKNSRLAGTICEITPERLLLETDSPYLSPVPHRGKRNESAFIVHTAHYVADALGIDYDHLCDTTTANAAALFRL